MKQERQVVVGIEFKVQAANDNEGMMVKCWEAGHGAVATGKITEEDLLEVPQDSVRPILALQRMKKGKWELSSDRPKANLDTKEKPEDWWWFDGSSIRELKMNAAMWQV